ncbi:MAG TPA: lipoyl(octanoyl) transferase LipB [Leptospiraceae bacterium]|nr:lipoyl(octanoyl) transferase LipB [Leptospiraceae bacterium]HMX32918.1 lipoyl(octanoyl) transferase LipB [Leptospiraceae bacterium]HMY31521.1 lipoyl(octanoyl) transferase LipB [Leptospiraceae bacterium]HMZ66312.1 lipoyl(octanoyl) transferase LipB [Leptospiraceae bacterium]HNA06675.1 lipoyl(octanoyl) transferase LipB [Leptospiraceae bacterium]
MKFTNKLNSVPYNRYIQLQSLLRKKRREIIIFLEHTSTITAGINYNIQNLLVSEEYLTKKEIEFCRIERGGDLTAHETGQLVIYPHIDLKKRSKNIGEYLSILTNSMIESVYSVWQLKLVSDAMRPGLYLEKDPIKKIVSMGVYFKSFFTSYGVALNLRNDLNVFQLIHPCGQDAANMVSLKKLGFDISEEKELEFIKTFQKLFLEKINL